MDHQIRISSDLMRVAFESVCFFTTQFFISRRAYKERGGESWKDSPEVDREIALLKSLLNKLSDTPTEIVVSTEELIAAYKGWELIKTFDILRFFEGEQIDTYSVQEVKQYLDGSLQLLLEKLVLVDPVAKDMLAFRIMKGRIMDLRSRSRLDQMIEHEIKKLRILDLSAKKKKRKKRR